MMVVQTLLPDAGKLKHFGEPAQLIKKNNKKSDSHDNAENQAERTYFDYTFKDLGKPFRPDQTRTRRLILSLS